MTELAVAPEIESVSFQTHPQNYRHWNLEVDGDIARMVMSVNPDAGLRPGYELKLNSYDLGVDIELADAIQRIRFEHPQVRCLVISGNLDKVFCAGANIMMLRSSSHGWKVNFCKYTNETRLYLEDLSENSEVKTLAACNGTTAGGGYELALACDRVLLVDDRSSAVSLPEVSLLAVLPGTGGLTRVVDKRMVRRDLADVFCSVAEGLKGKKALEWGLVDDLAPLSKFEEHCDRMATELANSVAEKTGRQGIRLIPLDIQKEGDLIRYDNVQLKLQPEEHRADLEIQLPAVSGPANLDEIHDAGSRWWIFNVFRQLDDALLQLRINYPEVSLITIRVVGDGKVALQTDEILEQHKQDWLVREVRFFMQRVLKRLDNTAKSLFALADEGTAFYGSFLELALAADRFYVLDDPETPVQLGISSMNGGAFPMANGLSRLATRFLGTPEKTAEVLERVGEVPAEDAEELGLATVAMDEIDWEDEIRVALEERVSFSPDALTGMEANLRFAGPETLETKIFGRLSAWQNWIFQRPNAVGPTGALQCYGTPNRPELDYTRT